MVFRYYLVVNICLYLMSSSLIDPFPMFTALPLRELGLTEPFRYHSLTDMIAGGRW